jgi:hypothetical protein
MFRMAPPFRVLQQVRDRVLAPEKDALEVYGDDAVEVLLGGVGDRLRHRDAGVVEDDVQLAVPPDRAVYESPHVLAGGHVRADELGATSVRLDLLGSPPSALLVNVP